MAGTEDSICPKFADEALTLIDDGSSVTANAFPGSVTGTCLFRHDGSGEETSVIESVVKSSLIEEESEIDSESGFEICLLIPSTLCREHKGIGKKQ